MVLTAVYHAGNFVRILTRDHPSVVHFVMLRMQRFLRAALRFSPKAAQTRCPGPGLS